MKIVMIGAMTIGATMTITTTTETSQTVPGVSACVEA
jgi:hypothetical protein